MSGRPLGFILFSALVVAAAGPTAARANPIDAFGIGARAPALGSAYAAIADDSSAGYYNPAGLAQSGDVHIDIGYQFARPQIAVSGVDQALMDTRGMNAGIILPGELFGVRFAFGATLFLPDQEATRIRVQSFDQPRLQLYENRGQRLYMAANLALHIWRGLYIGGGLTFMSRSQGTVSLRGTISLSDPESSALESSTDVSLLAVRYPQVGILVQATRQLSLALVYRHKFVLELEQGFNIMADIGNPGQPPIVSGATLKEVAQSVDLFQPWELVAGAALRPWGRVLISFDLTFSRWSEQPPPAATFNLTLDLGQFNNLVKLPPTMPYPDAGFHDTLMPALGVEWRAIDQAFGGRLSLDLRAGYRYEPSPVPDQVGESNLGDADRHIFSFGGGLELRPRTAVITKPLALDVFAALGYLPERYFYKLDPSSQVGDYTVAGHVWQAGAQLRWRL